MSGIFIMSLPVSLAIQRIGCTMGFPLPCSRGSETGCHLRSPALLLYGASKPHTGKYFGGLGVHHKDPSEIFVRGPLRARGRYRELSSDA